MIPKAEHITGKNVNNTGHEIAPNIGNNVTKCFILVTKLSKLVTKLPPKTLPKDPVICSRHKSNLRH